MPALRTSGGKLLRVGGKLSTGAECCCETPCPLPADVECPHSICVQFKLDANDTSDGDILEAESEDTNSGFGFYLSGGSWQGYGYESGTGSAVATSPMDTWHTLMVQTSNDDLDENVTFEFFMDGNPLFSFDQDISNGTGLDWNNIFTGARFSGSGDVHRSVRAVDASGNPDADPSEANFSFPTTPFDSLSGDAVIDGSGFLRIDGTTGYGQYELPSPWCIHCSLGGCCPDNDDPTCELKTESQCNEIGGEFSGICTTCDDALCSPTHCCDTAKIDLSSLDFCADCILAADNPTLIKVEDFNVLSSSPFTLPADGRVGTGYFQSGDCVWELDFDSQPQVTLKEYVEGDCADDTPTATQTNCRVIAAKINDTYYVMIFASPTVTGVGGAHMFLFYGESGDPLSISNQLSDQTLVGGERDGECDTTFNATEIDNIFTDFAFGDGTPGSGGKLGTIVAQGGSITGTIGGFCGCIEAGFSLNKTCSEGPGGAFSQRTLVGTEGTAARFQIQGSGTACCKTLVSPGELGSFCLDFDGVNPAIHTPGQAEWTVTVTDEGGEFYGIEITVNATGGPCCGFSNTYSASGLSGDYTVESPLEIEGPDSINLGVVISLAPCSAEAIDCATENEC